MTCRASALHHAPSTRAWRPRTLTLPLIAALAVACADEPAVPRLARGDSIRVGCCMRIERDPDDYLVLRPDEPLNPEGSQEGWTVGWCPALGSDGEPFSIHPKADGWALTASGRSIVCLLTPGEPAPREAPSTSDP